MGCCVSAANNIQEPQNKNNKPTKQTDSEIKHEYSQEKQEIQPNNEDQNEYQNQEKKFVQRKHDPPCKYPKPQKKDDDEMDQFYTSNPKVLKPPRNEKLHKLIKFGREYIEQMHHNSETDKQIINEIEQLIFNKQITIQELNEIAIKYNKTLIQTLFLKGCQGITLLELILIYIEDFEIITHLLQEHQLPINDDLYYIVLRIISKIKPLRKIDSQVQLSINFIKQIYNFQQIKSLLLHKDAIIFFNGFSNFCSEFNLKNRIHIKLLGTIVKLLKNFQIDSTLDLLYKNAKIDSYFTYLQVPKSIPKGQVDQINCSKIELTYLKMNLFHWIALKNEWLLFKQYSNNYYQQLDVSEQSPFMIFMEKSPINFILEYLNEYPSQLKQASNYSTSQGKNILHCFFMNKNISEQHEEEILKILANFQSLESLKQLLLQAYHDQIPLICYLDSHQNVLNSVCEFLSQYITKEFNFIKQFIQATEISHMIKKTKYKDLKKNHNLYIHEKYYFFLKINNKLRKQELQTKKLTENDIIYLHYIQLVKQVIKKDFKVNFDWIKTFNIYTSYFPYDIGTTQQTFMNVLLRKGHQEQVKQTITQIVELIKSNENVDAYINTQIEFSLKAQLLAQLISFKKEQRQYPYQIVYDLVDTIVMEQINENPKLLIVSIYGNSDFKLIGYQTIYSTLVQLNDQKLQESCLTAQLLFDIDQKTKQQFLNTAFELQLLNSKDHLLKKIFDSFSIRAKLNMVRQNKTHIFQITLYDHLNQKEDQEIFSIHFSTFLQLETKGKLSKRSIIQQFLEKDDNNKQNQYVSVNLTYPNLLVLNQHIDTQKKFIEIAEIYPFPFLSKFWLMKEKINFNPQIQIGKNNKKTATFCNLILDHYELAFDWQMTGILVNIINSVVPQKNILYTLSHKKQVIYYQINQKISFLEALAQSDKLSQEFQSYMSTFQNGKQNFKLNLSKMIKLGAIYNNIIYLSNFYSQNLIGFIVKLADENFSFEINGKRKTYTQDNKKVSKFNKLLSILLELDIPKHEKEDKITYNFSNIISLITLENWKKINYNTKTSIYETFNKESVIELLYQDKNQEILKLIIEDIFNRWSIEQIELIINHCTKSLPKNLNILNFILSKVIKMYNKEESSINLIEKLYVSVFQHSENLAMQYLEQIKLSKNKIYYLYGLVLRKSQDYKTLNLLLHYCENNSLELDNQIFKVPLKCPEKLENYYKALSKPYYLVFSLEQYQDFYKQITLTEDQKIKHTQAFIENGLYEKLQFILSQVVLNFEVYSVNYFEIVKNYLEEQLSIKFENYNNMDEADEADEAEDHQVDVDENGNEIGKNTNRNRIQFFDLQHNQIKFKQLKNKRSDQEINQEAEKIVKEFCRANNLNLLKRNYIKKVHKIKQQLNFEQSKTFSEQKQDRTVLFMNSGGQKVDYFKCIEIIQKQFNAKKIKSKEILANFELYSNLLNPKNKKIEKCQELVKILLQVFEKNKFPNKFLSTRTQGFIDLYNANVSSKQVDVEFEFPNRFSQYQKQFFLEILLSLKNDQQNQTANLIISQQHENVKCVKFLQKNLSELEIIRFNSTTLFYVTKQVEILKKNSYYFDDLNLNKNSDKIKASFYKLQYPSEQLTKVQVFLRKGRHDHITKQQQFQQINLVAAIMGNNYTSIIYALNLHTDPINCGLSNNLFQILIIQQCETNIIKYFNQFIKGKVKAYEKLLSINGVPILYYVFYKNMEKVFKECFINYLTNLLGKQKTNDLIRNQLQLSSNVTEYKIYQIALLNKCYYILNYLDGIIIQDDLQLINSPFILKTQIHPQNVEENSKEDQFYKKYFELLSLAQQPLFWPQYEKLKMKVQEQKNQSKKKKVTKKKKKFYKKKTIKNIQSNNQVQKTTQKSLYVKDKQLNELILFEQACLNQVFKLQAQINLKNQLLSLSLSDNKLECLEKYKYPEQLLRYYINHIKSNNLIQNIDQVQLENFFKKCLQNQILHNNLISEIIQLNPLLLLSVVKAINVTLEIGVILYSKLKDTPQFEKFLNYHQNMFRDYIRIPQKGVPIEDEVIEEEEYHPIPVEYMKPSVAYLLILLNSIKKDIYDENLFKQEYISTPLLLRTYDLMKQQMNQQSLQQIKYTSNTQQFLRDFSGITLNIDQDHFQEYLISEENSLETSIIKSMISIKQIDIIIENFKKQCQQYIKEKKDKQQYKQEFQVYFGDEEIQIQEKGFKIFLTIENNQISLKQIRIDRILETLKQQKHQKQLEEQPQIIENILQIEFTKMKQFNSSKFDLSCLNTIDFENLCYQNIVNKIIELIKPQGKCGQYEIDDLFAPHQHEQIRQPELTQQVSIQQPVLQRQQSSQIGQSFSAINLSKQISTSQRQKLKDDFQFMLELLPDNTYQVRQKNKKQNQKDIIFSEFYQFQQPNIKLNLIKLSQQEFIEQYNSRKSISIVVQNLYKYNEYLGNLIEGQLQQDEWIIDFPFYILQDTIKFSECLFSTHCIQLIFNKLYNFIEKVKSFSEDRKKEKKKLIWRINTTSFLEVFVSKLIDLQIQKCPLIEIYSLIDALLEWNSLIMIFSTLIYHNLEQAQQVVKVIRGVYVEFNEISDLNQQNCQFVDTNNVLDKTFLFGNTSYLLQNQILIIRLNVKLQQNISQVTKIENNLIIPDSRIQLYYHNILNIYDFFNQIFSPDQLVQFIFNKLEVDRSLLNFSNKISQFISKVVILSVDHSQLIQIFSGEILRAMSIKNNETKYKELESIWFILNKLYHYFTTDLYDYLINQFITERFNSMFNIRFYCLLSSIRYKMNINDILNSNQRQIQKSKGGLVLEKICNLNKEVNTKLYFKFGFQLTISFYISNCKLGDICAVCYYDDSHLNLFYGQMVCNTKPGCLIFHNITKYTAKSQDEIIRLQQTYLRQNNYDQSQSISLEDIQSIVLFQSNWPTDHFFNNSILNLFITNFEQELFICNEKNFIKAMVEIQNEVDEKNKQDKLDNLFGVGLISSYSDINVTQMTPTFVDQINFDFISHNQLKRQQSIVQPNTVFVRINEDKFELDLVPTQPLNTASYFESNVKNYILLSKINTFLDKHEEFNQVYFIFDDELDQFANKASDRIITENNCVITFIKGYEQFISNENQSSINSSLQIFFGIQSISSLKIKIITNLISKVEIIFAPFKEDHDRLINLQNQTLKIYSLLAETKIIYPEINEVSNFFYNLIINYKDPQQINDNPIDIRFNDISNLDFIKSFVDSVLIAQHLQKLLKIIDKENQIKLIHLQATNEIVTTNKNSFYQFQDDQIIINYFKCQDFSFSNFILDYLNKKDFNQNKRQEYQISYSGSEILNKPLLLNPREIFSGFDQQDQIELLSIVDMNTIIRNQEKADPQEFNDLILIPKINGFYADLFYFKSSKHPIFDQYNRQQKKQFQVGEEIKFILHPINPQIDLEQQLQKVWAKLKYSKIEHKTYNLNQLINQKQQQENFITKVQFLTQNFMLLTIKSEQKVKIDLYSKLITLSYQDYQFSNFSNCEFNIQTLQDLEKTVHVQVTHNQKTYQVANEKNEHLTFGKGNQQMMKILQKEAKKNHKENFVFLQQESTTHSNELQAGNAINMISNQDKAVATRAGVQRQDQLTFRDSNCNIVENFTIEKVTFVHSLFYQIQYEPDKKRKDDGLCLIWTPTFKGIYHLYIDGFKIEGRFIVLANVPDLGNSKVEIQDNLEVIPFCEKIQISFYLKDKFENCYGDTENQIFSESNCNVKQVEGYQSKLNLTFNNLNKIGSLNANIIFDPTEVSVLEDRVAIEFYINNQLKKDQILKLSGLGLEKRRQKFQNDLNQLWKPTNYNLNISRVNFLEELLELAEKKLNYSFSIKFLNEPGIDAGGLKREFYDMIGNTLKDENYKFFSPVSSNQSKYFLNPKFNKQKNKERYALLFGKLIANSICNSYLIGIDIIAPFWKVVFDERIVFQDLSLIWDKDTYNNYEKLKSLSEEELESVCLVFTYSSGNNEAELINKGSQINVTKKNLELYLNKTAEYVIYKQFDKIYKSFIEGFQSILDISICQKWLMPQEMSLLTQGLLEIKSEILLQKFHFSGGKPQHKSYFETYISQSSPETLKNMLKFITGSSSIPYDQSSYVITVRFEQGLSDRKLPLSHTCFKSIEVPHYKSFAELKQKLDIAFTIGFEGYGFG